MSYTRDKDAHTRGVGAIAAADGSRTRLRKRIAIGRALRARDRVMAAYTLGPNGGAVGLGAINTAGTRPGWQGGRPISNTTIDGGSSIFQPPGRVPPPQPGGHGGMPTPHIATAQLRAGGTRVLAPGPYQPGTRPAAGGGVVIDPGPGGAGSMYTCADGTQVSDLAACSVSTQVQTTGTTGGGASGGSSSGGGGGGGGGVMTGGSGPPPDLTPPASPDEIPAGAGMSTTEKVVIAAAALGGLYLLFGKKRGAP